MMDTYYDPQTDMDRDVHNSQSSESSNSSGTSNESREEVISPINKTTEKKELVVMGREQLEYVKINVDVENENWRMLPP